jgi:myo-inositol 2-dehydrogenase/D-chiro-inositol 1-dehydrogenase
MSHSANVRIGVIGAGRIGGLHAEHVARRVAGAELAAIADVNLPAAQQLAARLGTPTAAADYRTLLTQDQAVVICSPTDTHARLIVAAAGKHLLRSPLTSTWPASTAPWRRRRRRVSNSNRLQPPL